MISLTIVHHLGSNAEDGGILSQLILQICDYVQKRRIRRENCKYVLDENFHCNFCSRQKAAKFCHPGNRYGIG